MVALARLVMDETANNVGGLMGWMQAQSEGFWQESCQESEILQWLQRFSVFVTVASQGVCHGKIYQGASSSALHELYDGGI